ncbi:hypothetical protein A2262_04215 [Candidatus Roizmanbacteria bacterium RIFOXYA2_FULL_41_8]|nr:MAG: hypothetical protein A2262_04215 [Candidatus Roizmanbacteria bacterium RIFOXYA2_FULL_41_8]
MKITLKNLIKFWLIILVFLSLSISQVMADRMGSDSYEFVFTNINMGGRTTGSPNYTLDMSLGQTVAKRWEENGYIVRAGFQYIHILYPFSFELSDTTLDFGTLIPGTPVTEQLTATITHRGQGYEVMVYQDHKLQTFDGNTWIEDTACDNPYCDADTAESWISSAVYGFGYNVTGHDVSADFNGSADYFRPFSTSPVTFMESSQAARNRQSVITAKINIDNTQEAGTYQTVLRFIALPKF